MKYKLIFGLLMLLLVVACDPNKGNDGGGNNGNNLDPIVTPLPSTITAIGEALNGTGFTRESIDQTGGSITSSDGRLTLVVPPGALANPTNVNVQLIENTMPTGFGFGFRIALQDIVTQQDAVLTQPASLEFALSDSELTNYDIAPENLTVAFQDANGQWQISPDAQTTPLAIQNQTNKATRVGGSKVTAKLKKTGDYALATRYKMFPTQASVKVNDERDLRVVIMLSSSVDATSGFAPVLTTEYAVDSWAVNGVAGGDASVGQLTQPFDSSKRMIYKAPAKVPSSNPVRVTARVKDSLGMFTVSSRIRVEDSKGWINAFDIVYHHEESSNDVGSVSLTVSGEVSAKYSLSNIDIHAPQFGLNGYVTFEQALDPDGKGSFEIGYKKLSKSPCGCGLPGVYEITTTTYNFTANDVSPKDATTGKTGGLIAIKPSGEYEFDLILSALKLEGDYTLSVVTSSTCDNKPPPDPTNSSGKDTVILSGNIGDKVAKGKVKPEGPDRMTGTTSRPTINVSLPDSLPYRPSITGGTIIDWYVDYTPSMTKGNSVPPTLPQAPVPPQLISVPMQQENVVKPRC